MFSRLVSKVDLFVVMILILSVVTACNNQNKPKTENKVDEIKVLAEMMTGSFASTEQAEADPENFYDIRLEMVPIWTARTDGPWLYIEQAVASSLDKPYRQRIYKLSKVSDDTYSSEVFTLPGEALEWAGAWKDVSKFDAIAPDSLALRDGCAIYLKKNADGTFAGSTAGEGCASTLRGAKYATSEVTITPTQLVSWDRGWDENGEHVWGAEKSGYIFKKVIKETD